MENINIKVVGTNPLAMHYDQKSKMLHLTGAQISGGQVSIQLDANSTWLLCTGLQSLAQLVGPLGEEPTKAKTLQ